MIPEAMRKKLGQRMSLNDEEMVDDFYEKLAKYDGMQDECRELEQLVVEADQMKKFDALVQISMQLEPLKVKLEKLVNEIKIQLVGRLVRPKTMKDLLYEVQDFNESTHSKKFEKILWGLMNDNRV